MAIKDTAIKTRIGITGQAGFVGWHLYRTLALRDDIELVDFARDFFESEKSLQEFVSGCDVIVHLAAMNRHDDPQVIYDTNIQLVKNLIRACEESSSKPYILFSSSTQENRDNLYGKSKLEGKKLFEAWAGRGGGRFTSLTIPNVFGPFGKPNYNSFVATFCYKIARGESPTIIQDNSVGLIYVGELVEVIINAILDRDRTEFKTGIANLEIEPRHTKKVSEILELLTHYKRAYVENGVFPNLDDGFGKLLFNTFRCYVPADHYPVTYTRHTDNRGSFVEIARTETSGQFSYSTTVPGITRGNHYHTRKAERFAVIKGKARIQLRKIGDDKIINYDLDGETPAYVDMPVWHTHNITNTGDSELITLFWINEPYNPEDADTYFEDV